jgi:hypothetical protein
VKMRVMPSFLPRSPVRIFGHSFCSISRSGLSVTLSLFGCDTAVGSWLLLNLHVNARRQVEAHEGVHCLGRRVQNVQQALVRAHFELLT